MRNTILLTGLLAISAGIYSDDNKISFRPGAKAMRNELRRLISVGTEIKAAETIMVANAFTCKRRTNDDFLATDVDSNDSKMIQRRNFLLCEHTEVAPTAVTKSRRWRVAIVNEEEKVANILVNYSLVGE